MHEEPDRVEGASSSARAVEQRYLDLFGQMSSGVTHCRLTFEGERCVDWVYLQANAAFSRQTGLFDVIGRRLSEVLPGVREHEPAMLALCARVAQSGRAEQHEYFVAAQQRWYAVSIYRLTRDEIVIVGDDVTARKRDEIALRESEQRLRLLVEHAPAAIAMFDRDMRYVATSRRFLHDYGLPAQDLVGRLHYEVFPELPEDVRAIHRRCLAGGVERSPLQSFERPDGRVDWVRWECMPWRDARGEIGGIVLFSEVLTEQERVRRALEASEARFRAIFEQAGVGMAQTDPATGRFLAVNDRACAIWGYTRDELLALSWPELTHPDDLSADRAELAPLFHGEIKSFTREKRYVRKSGETIWGRMTATRLDLPEGASLIGMIDDISERKRAEAALRGTEEQLRAAQRMEAVGRLAGGVAHDFNNLLSVIISYAELALDAVRTEDPVHDDLQEVIAASRRAVGLTGQLLAFSRKQLLAPEPVDLGELIGGLAKMLRRLIGEDVELAIAFSAARPLTLADRGQIEQVLMNLVVNARDAMPDGGRVTLSTGEAQLDAARAQSLDLPPGSYVFLEVGDTGCGMSDEVRSRVFEPFFTTKGPGKGTGLGLSTVYGIVRQSGGAVEVESAPGKGATFRVFLQPFRGEATQPPPRAPGRRPHPGHACVLVVEDEGALGSVIRRVLAGVGYEVLLADGPSAALMLAEQHGPRIQVILTDVIMPGMNGRELVDKLRPTCPAARVIFMSGYTTEEIERFVRDADFLRKPFELAVLLERVRAVLDERI